MRKIILFAIVLVILFSFTDVKTNTSAEANTYTIEELTYFTVHLIEDIKERNMKIDKAIEEGFIEEKTVEVKTVKVNAVTEEDSNQYQTFEITAYTAYEESTNKDASHPAFGITASGERVKVNHTAACPKSMPFGTELYIPYFDNTFVCTDRGGAIKNGKLDIYMKTVKQAREFGRRKLEVRVINPSES